MKTNKNVGENTLNAVWCIDSENPRDGWKLVDLETKEILARKDANGNIVEVRPDDNKKV